jgi:predicted amidohydrolase YtcJ
MKKIKFFMLGIAIVGLISCKNSTTTYKDITEATGNGVIYFGGDILTMVGDTPTYADAVWIKDGKIAYIGSLEEAKKQGQGAELANLEGKTLLPSFIDAHSHYINSLTVSDQANVSPKPITEGKGDNVDQIIETIKQLKDKGNIPKDSLIQAYGYDDTKMNGRLLNRDDLDKAFPDNPVIVGHISMHGAVLNSKALTRFNITKDTPTPKGGVIVRDNNGEPYGLIMETAYLPIFDNLPKPNLDQQIAWSKRGQMLYAEAGITTAHDGATKFNDLEIMKNANKANVNMIDIIAFPFIGDLKSVLAKYPKKDWLKYDNHLKIGGVKITIDGSPQGKTAFFHKPYRTGSPSDPNDKKWTGELTFSQDEVTAMVGMVYDMEVPLNLHANGDSAIATFLKAHEMVAKHDLGKERHVTMIHSQFVNRKQLEKYPKYKILPSFYTLHTYYFADAHIQNRGIEQASYMSPMKDAIGLGLKPTNHTDFVVLPLNQMMVLWSSVNRISFGNKAIGQDQCITPYQGLQAITIHPAIQYMEQATKGTLEKNKLADLVILDKNPLKEDKMKIKDIKVLQTIKEGKVIYCKECNKS